MARALPQMMKEGHKQRIILARHGNTSMNEEGDKIRGWKDVPLSPKGRQEVKTLARRLKGKGIDGVVSSDLDRAQETAKAISSELKVPILKTTKNLRPWNAGIFTGQESNKILSKLNHYIDHPAEKVPEGESFDSFKNRFLSEILKIKSDYRNRCIVLVAHHRNNVMLDAWIAAGEHPDFSFEESELKKKGIPPADFKEYMI